MEIHELITRIDAHILESDRRHQETAQTLKDFRVLIDSKVSNNQFVWIIGILTTVLMAVLGGGFGWISYQMENYSSQLTNFQITQDKTNQSVSMIQGKLDPYNVQFKN